LTNYIARLHWDDKGERGGLHKLLPLPWRMPSVVTNRPVRFQPEAGPLPLAGVDVWVWVATGERAEGWVTEELWMDLFKSPAPMDMDPHTGLISVMWLWYKNKP
jgi:hypothetical protein